MSVLVVGDDIVAWTKATVLASTGCQTWLCSASVLDLSGEPGLQRLMDEQVASGRLTLADRMPAADSDIWRCQIMIYAHPVDDSGALQQYSRQFAYKAQPEDEVRIIALTHPVPIGTTERLQQQLETDYSHTGAESGRSECDNHGLNQVPLAAVYWPGFIQSGRAIDSFSRSERIILGSHHEKATAKIRQLLQPFNRSKDTLIVMAPKEAELTKVAINGMLATRISFMNELADFADTQGIDIETVRNGIGSDSRIGFQYLYPGCGFGGEAFLNTLNQLVENLGEGLGAGLLNSVCQINEQQKDLLFRKFWRHFNADVKGRKVAIWGCSFKPGTASIYGSPAVVLVQSLITHGVDVRLYDPVALEAMRQHFADCDGIEYCDSPWQAAEQTDAVMLVTEWKEFWNIDLSRLAGVMKTPLLLDGRNIFDPAVAQKAGFVFSGIGRGEKL